MHRNTGEASMSCARSQLPSLVAAGTIALVTLFFTDLLAYLPNAARTLSVYVSLIVTNCIVLGRAEAFAMHNPVRPSIVDALHRRA